MLLDLPNEWRQELVTIVAIQNTAVVFAVMHNVLGDTDEAREALDEDIGELEKILDGDLDLAALATYTPTGLIRTPRASRPSESSQPREITAQEFGRTLIWRDMEPKSRFDNRMPTDVVGRPVGQVDDTRRFRYSFPRGGALILRARPCGGEGSGLCVWSVDVE